MALEGGGLVRTTMQVDVTVGRSACLAFTTIANTVKEIALQLFEVPHQLHPLTESDHLPHHTSPRQSDNATSRPPAQQPHPADVDPSVNPLTEPRSMTNDHRHHPLADMPTDGDLRLLTIEQRCREGEITAIIRHLPDNSRNDHYHDKLLPLGQTTNLV